MKTNSVYRKLLAMGCASGALAAGTAAHAELFQISQQSAATGIAEFARQAGLQILAPAAALTNKRTNALDGDMSAGPAIKALLKGTGLKVRSNDGRTIVISLADDPAPAAEPMRRRIAYVTAPATSDPAPAPDDVKSSTVGEIVVTAEKHSERLVNTPISVSIVSGDALEEQGVTSSFELTQSVPGLHMDGVGTNTQPTIRGVGSAISGPGLSSNVATYVDGFYRPSTLATDMKFFDVSSVQVLKGPQGTLFGRNATGGAILITTDSPTQTPTFRAKVSYGSYNTVDVAAFASGGITANLAGSISAFASDSDGFVKNIVTGANAAPVRDYGGRAKLLFNPTDRLSFELTLEHTQIDDSTYSAQSNYRGWTDAVFVPGAVIATQPKQTSITAPYYGISDSDAIYLKSRYDLGFASLTSYTGFLKEEDREALDLDGSSANVAAAFWKVRENTFTQEFDLASSRPGPLTWAAGLYYFYNDSVYPYLDYSVGGSPYFLAFRSGVLTNSVAAFADGTYNVLGNLYITLGARYSYDNLIESFVFFPTGYHPAHTWNNIKPRAVLRYQLTPSSNIYASYTQGYKSGVFNANGGSPMPVNPEDITAYEVGYKFSNSRFQFEGAAFYYDYDNLQISVYNPPNGSGLLNAASAQIYGLDAHFVGRLTDQLTVELGGAYTHGRYTRFPNDPDYNWNPVLGATISSINGAGFTMQRTPEFQGNLGITYKTQLAGGGLQIHGEYSYVSKVYLDPADVTEQPGYGLLSARVAWTDPSDHWTFAVYGNNLTNQKYINSLFPSGTFFGQTFGAPLMFGGEIQLKY